MPPVDRPPGRVVFVGGLGGAACVLLCSLPLLVGIGLVGAGGAALLGMWLPAAAVFLFAVAGLFWWQHRRRVARSHRPGGCGDELCPCSSGRE